MMISPGLRLREGARPGALPRRRARPASCSRKAFADGRRKRWRLNHTPLFLDFLEGKVDFGCTAWGIPSYSLFGWQRPCYLMADGYAKTYKELIETTDWDEVRPRQGPALRQLHGALRLRADGRARHHGLAARDDPGRARQLYPLAGLAAAKARTAGPSPTERGPRGSLPHPRPGRPARLRDYRARPPGPPGFRPLQSPLCGWSRSRRSVASRRLRGTAPCDRGGRRGRAPTGIPGSLAARRHSRQRSPSRGNPAGSVQHPFR